MAEEIIFEWDENKNLKNIEKHGIDFNKAAKIFEDDNRLDLPNIKHSQTEMRRKVIGMVESILFVVYTIRSERIRIISARSANIKERIMYYVNCKESK